MLQFILKIADLQIKNQILIIFFFHTIFILLLTNVSSYISLKYNQRYYLHLQLLKKINTKLFEFN